MSCGSMPDLTAPLYASDCPDYPTIPRSLVDAKRREDNVLLKIQRFRREKQINDILWSCRSKIQRLVMSHLGLMSEKQCFVESPQSWLRGRFNACVFLQVTDNQGSISRKVFRCPLHSFQGEEQSNASDEKVRVEVGNYAWIAENCPEVPAPHLIGFGFPGGHHFTHESHLSLHLSCYHRLIRAIRPIFGLSKPSSYVRQLPRTEFAWPYMLLDFIGPETGKMLSDTWDTFSDDLGKKQNLMRGLSRITQSLAGVSMPEIGSFRFNDDSSVSLVNRPILSANSILEEEGAPKMPQRTYSSSGAFVSALLDFRQQAFEAQPNAVNDGEDCVLQMAHFVVLRAIMSQSLDVHYDGPFVLQHTDLHASNVFVDQDWNVTGVIDLESVCSLPPDMISFPYWLAAESIDELVDKPEQVERTFESYAQIFEGQQTELRPSLDLTMWMRKAWDSRTYYFYLPFTSVNGFTAIVEDHILPMFGFAGLLLSQQRALNQTLSKFWSRRSAAFVAEKVADKQKYDKDLEAYYSDKSAT